VAAENQTLSGCAPATDDEGRIVADKFTSPPDEGDQGPVDDESASLADQIFDSESEDGSVDDASPDDDESPDFDALVDEESADEKPTPVQAAKSARPKKKPAQAPAEADDETASETDETAPDEGEETRPVRRELTQAPVKKNRPTAKQSDAATPAPKHTSPLMFARQSIGELKKVVWPSGDVTGQYFVVVLVFVVFIMAVVFGLDQLFGWGLIKWLG
jgi:preprotein translocase subunit SecE